MRKGEVLGLKWTNIDLRNGLILLDKTKNGERREIPINLTVRDMLQALPRRIAGRHQTFIRNRV
jgi:integrase